MNKSFFPIVLIIIICIYFLSVYSSKNELVFDKNIIRIQIVDSIKTLGIYNQITTQYINGSKVKNKSWLKRNWIMENATIAELTKLTDHSNSVVKSIAYEGLLRKTEVDKFLLLEKVLKDTTSILWVQSGCVSNEIFLGEHLMENVLSLS